MSGEMIFKMVSPDAIIIPELLLRDAQTSDESYLVMKGSIGDHGIRNPLLVVPGTHEGTYILCDGMQRLSIAKDLKLSEVPVKVESMSESEAQRAQVDMNIARVEVDPKTYSEWLGKYANLHPNCTVPELAKQLNVAVSWLRDRLDFKKLSATVQTAVVDGNVALTKAILLKGLEHDIQDSFIEKAMILSPDAFSQQVSDTRKEIAKAKREGRPPAIAEYVHEAKIRTKPEILEELANLAVVPALVDGLSGVDAAIAALKWAVKLDPKSVEEGKAGWEAQKQQAKDRAERKKAEREATKAAAAEAAAAATRG